MRRHDPSAKRHDHREGAGSQGHIDREAGAAQQDRLGGERRVVVLAGPGGQVAARLGGRVLAFEVRQPGAAIGGGDSVVGRRMAIGADESAARAERRVDAAEEPQTPRRCRDVVQRQRCDDGRRGSDVQHASVLNIQQ